MAIETPQEKTSFEPIEIGKKEKRKKETEKISFGIFLILKREFVDLFSIKRVLPYIVLSFIFPFIFSAVAAGNLTTTLSDYNINYQISTVVNYYAFYAFFWNAGILLWVFCGLTASTFISGEETNGTLVFLLTKPIRRTTVFVGKFLGYFLNMAILQLFSLFLGLTITCSSFQVSSVVFLQSLYYLIPTYLFALIMIIVVGILMGFMSIVSKRAVVNILVLMIIVLLVYFLGLMFRVAIPGFYEQWNIYIIDIGYNLSAIYTSFLNLFGFQPTPFFQQNFGLFFGTYVNQFTNISAFLGASDTENGLNFLLPETGYINPIISIIFLAVFVVVILIVGIVILERKDVSG